MGHRGIFDGLTVHGFACIRGNKLSSNQAYHLWVFRDIWYYTQYPKNHEKLMKKNDIRVAYSQTKPYSN